MRVLATLGAGGAVLGALTATDYWELLAIVVLIGLAGVLAAAETSITRMNRVRAHHLQEEGKRGSRQLVRIVENPARYLNVVLLLTLLVHLGGTTLATVVAVRHLRDLGEIVATVAMTVLLFVFAEITPKTFAVMHTDRVALRLAPFVVGITRAFGPVARALIGLANVIMPGKGLPQGPFVTEQEIRAMAEMASEEEAIEEEEKELIHSIFEFGDTLVREVMVPRPDMVTAPVEASVRDVLDLMLKHGYSRIPLYRGSIDDVVGVAYAKDLLRHLHAGKEDVALASIMREPYVVPETKKVSELLKEMQAKRVHMAIVVDEYGSTSGLVTIEDILEELVGEIADEYDREEPQVEPVDEHTYRVNGRLSIDELNELLGVDLPHEEWDTVAGLMYGLLGAVPTQGEQVTYDNLVFTAEKVQGRRIAKVLIQRRPEEGRDQEAGVG
ncbi:MAG TPA: hemolysin family protein [Actinomycetota bacterium]|nr:hemolysin family protein [Actinomycetota bacterium]